MGKIFSPQELAQGQVPEAANFAPAAQYLLDTLWAKFVEQGEPNVPFEPAFNGFDSAVVFGSTSQGMTTRRSDLDILMCYTVDAGDTSSMISGYQTVFAEVEDRWHTPVEPIIFHTGDLLEGHHTLDPFFMMHLNAVPSEWTVGANPVSFTKDMEDGGNLTSVFSRYALHKQMKFTKALARTSPEIEYKVMQRALELPGALGRKSLALLASRGQLEDESYHSVSKARVVARIDDFTDQYSEDALKALLRSDVDYNELLDATLGGNTNTADYELWLRRSYHDIVSAALDFTTNFSARILYG